MTTTHILGFPRIGARRELKLAQEAYWRGEIDEASLRATGAALRNQHWALQRAAGLAFATVGDFAYYDHVHNHTALFGAAPARYDFDGPVTLPRYFDMARGNAAQPALAMTKWFDSNYHYLVPEFGPDTDFRLNPDWLFPEVSEALGAGHAPKVTLLGPLTYLYLGREKTPGYTRLSSLALLLNSYWAALRKLQQQGVIWVQFDEPILALDLPLAWLQAFETVYRELAPAGPRLLLATYFGDVSAHAALLRALPIAGLHLDLVRAPEQATRFLESWPVDRVLSAGIIDGRNIWRSNLTLALSQLAPLRTRWAANLWLAPSCSLLHVPVQLADEPDLNPELRGWLAFATEKLAELQLLACGLDHGHDAIAGALAANDAALRGRTTSPRVRNPRVAARLVALTPADERRADVFGVRAQQQAETLDLPLFPTTTIGSFPQTPAIRQARAALRQGRIDPMAYAAAMRQEIAEAIAAQETLGLDVLVHGEAERNDMVEYFGEQLAGFAFTDNGWVQSYGSRCVKPPIIFGDVSRPQAMTVAWTCYAQSLTTKPVKGMLTGPVTLLQWSFVRDDQPRSATALQLALAVRDEVQALEAAGCRIIQIDEPAFREGLPLHRADWPEYLAWAVRAFRIASAVVGSGTQIHSHMCYSEFNDILLSIAALDADVITIETSRSDMALLDAFGEFRYPNGIGPGVYDIHSPRVPSVEDISRLLAKAAQVIAPERLWVNPDCGLKTRAWPETFAALRAMVSAARALRETHAARQR